MKIVISSTGPDLDSAVDPRFGRAAYLLIVDSESGELVESINNATGVNAGQGAGIKAASLIVDKGAEVVLTGRLGPNAMAVVEKANIKIVSNISGTVREAVAQFGAKGSVSGIESESSAEETAARVIDPGLGLGRGMGKGQGGWCGGGGQGRGGKCRQGQG